MLKTIVTILTLGLVGINTANASEEYDKKRAEMLAYVATNFFDPGSKLVMKVLEKIKYFGYIDLGLNLTALTTYEVGDIIFPGGFKSSNVEQSWESLAQFVILRDIRQHFANPEHLSGVYTQIKSVAIPALLHKIGKTRINQWLYASVPMFETNGFDPSLGKSYEEWRTGGCQWYYQVDQQGYTPKLSKQECEAHAFTKALQVDRLDVANKAQWYGFLWRRYLEGSVGLVAVWQNILSDIAKAANPSLAGRS